jgi:small GTP-binding protein
MTDPPGTAATPGPRFKVVFVGNSSVGKTSIIMRYCDQSFFDDRPPTIGSAFVTREFTKGEHHGSLQIWDTAGQERYRSLVPMYSRGAAVAVIVFDMTNRESFEDLDIWIDEMLPNVDKHHIVIAANKIDLAPAIETNEVENWAKEKHIPKVYVSAKSGEGVPDLFQQVTAMLPEAAWALRLPDVNVVDEKGDSKGGCC